jgi:membrane protease YdiL (CAAX protease family)
MRQLWQAWQAIVNRRPGLLTLTMCVIEVLYLLGRIQLQKMIPGSTSLDVLEISMDAWRCLFIAVYAAAIDWDSLKKTPSRAPRYIPLLVILVLANWLTISSMTHVPSEHAVLFAATSIFPAVREELFYRAILQRYLITRVGVAFGLAIASIAFAASHIGASAETPLAYTMLFTSGLVVGIIYQRTKSLALVIVLHTLADVWAAVAPDGSRFLSAIGVFSVVLVVFAGIIAWYWLDRRTGTASLVPATQ